MQIRWCTCHCAGYNSVQQGLAAYCYGAGNLQARWCRLHHVAAVCSRGCQCANCNVNCASQVQVAAVCSQGGCLLLCYCMQCAMCKPCGAVCTMLQQCAAEGGAGYNWPPGCPQAISHVRPGQQQPAFQFRPPGCTWLHPTCKSAHPLPRIKSCTMHNVYCTLNLVAPTSCKSAHPLLPNTKSCTMNTESCTAHHVNCTLNLAAPSSCCSTSAHPLMPNTKGCTMHTESCTR